VFCASHGFWRGRYRLRDADSVVSEINYLVEEFHPEEIVISDDLWISDKRRFREIVEKLKKLGIPGKVSFRGFVRSNIIQEDDILLLKQMNYRLLRFGAETGSEDLLRRLKGDNISVADHQRVVDLCHRHGMPCSASFMFGIPGETMADLKATDDFLTKNRGKIGIAGFYFFNPIPGTEIWEWMEDKKMVSADLRFELLKIDLLKEDFSWEDILYFNQDHVPLEEFKRFIEKIRRKFIDAGSEGNVPSRDSRKDSSRESVHDLTVAHGLCIGCGLCALGCAREAIALSWTDSRWIPVIDKDRCKHCGACAEVCPNTPEHLSARALAAAEEKEWYGLSRESRCYISHDADPAGRMRSASGGTLSALLKYLLEKRLTAGVITAQPVPAGMGSPHSEIRVIRTPEELERTRSSQYHPLRYDDALRDVLKTKDETYALVGLPCTMRGLVNLPAELRDKIKYRFCLICGRNATGRFTDCLARNEGVPGDVPFAANFRDKLGGIPDASNFNIHFRWEGGSVRTNRLKSTFTKMWRRYFFAPECCLYCPDFYGVEADLSVKDAWGRLSREPLGLSLLVARSDEVVRHLRDMRASGRIHLEECPREEISASQTATALFKHVQALRRFGWKRCLSKELSRQGYAPARPQGLWDRELREYFGFCVNIALSDFLYRRWNNVDLLLGFLKLFDMTRKKPV
jgi:coenzyme F420-reducing hydrogenase beta subunit